MALSIILLSSTAACSPPMNKEAKPTYRENPDPRQVRGVEVRVAGAPGAFQDVGGTMQFNVVNTDCLPPPDANPGGHTSPVPMHMIPFELFQGEDGVYRSTVFMDGMLDEDYHGRGVCRWKLVNVQVGLKATGAPGETLFMADLPGAELVPGAQRVITYLKAGYPRHPETTLEDPFSSGNVQPAGAAPLVDDAHFSITLDVTEVPA